MVNFNLSINLNFITNSALNTPKKRYAIAVGVNSSTTKLADTTKNLAVIFIDPALLILPTSNFTTYIDNAYKTLGVINTSLNAYTYSWDFGDGTTSTSIAPSKKYTASGTYNVTLTATGITGATSVKTTSITIP
ncbi:MAG: PKD domain-containing protein [Deinococcales bacterium]|nr:PKD domain-containing protein [Chitinophagaceae bacterium]